MVIAGIDEAGYGPLLGPLVVGCCAFEVTNCSSLDGESLPCLWKLLSRVIGKKRDKFGAKLFVNDSKVVYSPTVGVLELEKAILTIGRVVGFETESLDGFLGDVAGSAVEDLQSHQWYFKSARERFPIEQDSMSIRVFANALQAEFQRKRAACVYLAAKVLPEKRLNQLLEQTRNKSSVLFSTTAVHLDSLIKRFADKDLWIICDRQGGREHYGHLLRQMFEEWSLEIIGENGDCEYELIGGGNRVRIKFVEKAEGTCMSTAVASMLSKYLREALMMRFNAWWVAQIPGLRQTAGYYSDGLRFLQDIDLHRDRLGITREELARLR